MRLVRSRRGVRLVQGRDVWSDVLAEPGPTNGFFDILAACVEALAPGPRIAILGFAAGGIVGPLRGMGSDDPLEAVDTTRSGHTLFRKLCGSWAGDVQFTQAEASAWLRSKRRRYDLILEDLSVRGRKGAIKPRVSLEVLPELMQKRLRPSGLVVINVLPHPGTSWKMLLAGLCAPYREARLVTCLDYENRIVIAGRSLPTARSVSSRIRTALRGIHSTQASRIHVERFGPKAIRSVPLLPDRVRRGLRVLFVGINPGMRSAAAGHHFAGHSNRFWKLLYEAGLVPERIGYEDDARLLEWGYGLTNLVSRPTPGVQDLGRDDFRAGRRQLRSRVARLRPEVVALVGVTVYRQLIEGAATRPLRLGLQVEVLHGARLFVLPNPSGRNAHYTHEAMRRAFVALRVHLETIRGRRVKNASPP